MKSFKERFSLVSFAFLFLVTVTLSSIAEEVDVRIHRFKNGAITFDHNPNAAFYRVEWTSGMNHPTWSGSWQGFQCIVPAPTNGQITVAVPRFYRVTATLRGYGDRPLVIDPNADLACDELSLIPRGTNTTHSVEMGDFGSATVPVTTGIDYDLWMGKYEVTYDLYTAVRDAETAAAYAMHPGARGTGSNRQKLDATHLNQPVTEVNWYDAIKFCNKLSELNDLAPAYRYANDVFRSGEPPVDEISVSELTDGFRLPTEAEWEYCARGGLQNPLRMFPWGDTIDPTYAIYYYTVDAETQPVGSFPKGIAGGLGGTWDLLGVQLYEMAGNVYEWVWDRKGEPGSYQTNLKCSGAAYTSSSNLRCTSRQFAQPDSLIYGTGLRVCRSAK